MMALVKVASEGTWNWVNCRIAVTCLGGRVRENPRHGQWWSEKCLFAVRVVRRIRVLSHASYNVNHLISMIKSVSWRDWKF